MMKIYNIGDKVWYAGRKSTTESVVCPECFGKKYLTVILGDDSQVTIDCAGCEPGGCQPPRGYMTYYKQDIKVSQVTICKIEIDPTGVEYGYGEYNCGCHITKDTDIFDTEEEAEVRAKELAEQWNQEQLARIHQKEKNNRTWSWHVHYHRRQIRDAEETIERSKKKLDAATQHAKVSK